jgi:hypothetical protein
MSKPDKTSVLLLAAVLGLAGLGIFMTGSTTTHTPTFTQTLLEFDDSGVADKIVPRKIQPKAAGLFGCYVKDEATASCKVTSENKSLHLHVTRSTKTSGTAEIGWVQVTSSKRTDSIPADIRDIVVFTYVLCFIGGLLTLAGMSVVNFRRWRQRRLIAVNAV